MKPVEFTDRAARKPEDTDRGYHGYHGCREWRRRPYFATVVVGYLGLAFAALAADGFADWSHRQELRVDTTGLVKISLPVDTLDRARADLADLRLVDSQGTETPYWIERLDPDSDRRRATRGFRLTLGTQATVVLVETGTSDPLEGVTLQTPADAFIKAVQVEGSQDTNTWTVIGAGLPLFRQAQGREERLEVPLPRGSWRFLRFTIDDQGSPPVPFTGAWVHLAPAPSAPTEPVTVRLVAREEAQGDTRLTLDLGAARLPLAEIEVRTPEPFFRRPIRLMARQIEGITILEKELYRGLIQRVALDDPPGSSRVSLPLDLRSPNRELVLVIENADSPPLRVDEIRMRRWPIHLAFWATQTGPYTIYTGNPTCPAPQYELPTQNVDLSRTPVAATELSSPVPHPGHQTAANLPRIDEFAGQLDLDRWSFRKPVGVETAGVQELELDLEVLAHAQPGFADLRLMVGDRQLPYILERRSALRALKPIVRDADDLNKPRHSRWSIQLPFSNLPVTRLSCTSPTALFRREVVVYEEPLDARGGRYRRQLGRASWVQVPERAAAPLTLQFEGTPITDTLYLETDNEDNPPLQLSGFELHYPVVRLFFKSNPGTDLFLYYGNDRVSAPQYDLQLVASQIIAADKSSAYLGSAERLRAGGEPRMTGKGGILFWGALVVVVVGLLFVITRLVPKSSAPPP